MGQSIERDRLKPADAIIEKSREIKGVRRGRLFRKYFLLILALVCGALLISGAIGLYFSYQENKVALASVQREKAVGAAARIEQFILQIEQQLTYAAMGQLGPGGMEQRRIEFSSCNARCPRSRTSRRSTPTGASSSWCRASA